MHRILIIDDEPDVVEFQMSYLKRHKYEVCSAADSQQALEIIKSKLLDIVFCDVRLETDRAGLAVLAEAKKIKPDLVIYLLTGLIEKDIQEDGLSKGAKEVLIKPISNELLEAKIKACF